MLKRVPAKYMNLIVLLSLAILFVELAVRGGDVVIPAVIFGIIIYFGWKHFKSLFGKLMFFMGILAFIGNVFSLVAVQFFLIAMIALFIKYVVLDKEEAVVPPVLTTEEVNPGVSMHRDSLIRQTFIGNETLGKEPYSWRDVNIHGGFGDRTIDLSQTVIPDESVISIRHLFGSITVYVPYEVDVTVSHSTLFGNLTLFGESEKLVNDTVNYRNLAGNQTHVKIVTSILSGDLEVRRI